MSIPEDQAADFRAPEASAVFVIAVDSTSRRYDLSLIDLGTSGASVTAASKPATQFLYITIEAESGDVYWAVSADATATISDTATVSAGGTPSFPAGGCSRVPKDTEKSRIIDRSKHRYLVLKTASGTATARIYASSPAASGEKKP